MTLLRTLARAHSACFRVIGSSELGTHNSFNILHSTYQNNDPAARRTVTQVATPMTILLDAKVAVPSLVRAVLVQENVCWPGVGAGLDVAPPVGTFVDVFVGEAVGELVGVCVGEFVGVFVRGAVGELVDGVFVGGAVGELVDGVIVGGAVPELVDGVIVGGDVGLAEGGGGATSPSALSSPAVAAAVDAGVSAVDVPC